MGYCVGMAEWGRGNAGAAQKWSGMRCMECYPLLPKPSWAQLGAISTGTAREEPRGLL